VRSVGGGVGVGERSGERGEIQMIFKWYEQLWATTTIKNEMSIKRGLSEFACEIAGHDEPSCNYPISRGGQSQTGGFEPRHL
jgi:hypothetical protein